MTVHFPFQNTYAALPANFFARVAPTPVASPRLIKLNRPLAVHLGLDPDLLDEPGRRRNPRRKAASRRRRPDRDGLCRPPVRSFRAAARRRPRHPARRGDRRRRHPPRHPAQGLGPDAVFAPRRWPRRARSGAARIHRQRGDGRARHSDHAIARRGHDRRERDARDAAAGRGADPRRLQPHPRRHVPVFRRARRYRGRAAAGRSRHRQALSAGRQCRAPLSRAAGRRDRAPGRTGRALAAGRLHPRRDEHRQHLDLRRDHRLRPLRLHGPLRSGDGVLLDRRARPLRLRQPAADRAVEPDAAGGMPVAAVLRRPGQGHRRGAGAARRLRREVRQPPIRPACAARSACSRRATATRRWCRTCWMRWPRTRPTSPSPSGGWAMPRSIRPTIGEVSAIVRRSRRLRRMGGALAATDRRRAAIRRRAAGRDARGQSGLHSAQPPDRSGHRSRRQPRRLCAVRGDSGGAVEAVRGPAGIRGLCRAAASRDQRVLQTFCGT